MSKNSNFQRAIDITNDWPSWKKEYKLTKYSSQQQDSQTENKSTKKVNKKVATTA